MGFVKLDTGLLASTLWAHREEREVFITALLMAEPREIMAPTPQLEVDSLTETGFLVPMGWYGLVPAAGSGILRQALVKSGPGMAALRALGEPDPESRSKEFEGRRMVRVDGGYLILNYIKYRDRDYTTSERSRRYRARLRHDAEPSRRDAVTQRRDITQAEAEADYIVKAVHPLPPEGDLPLAPSVVEPRPTKLDTLQPQREEILAHWRGVAEPAGLPAVLKVSSTLKAAMSARLRDGDWLPRFREAVDFAARHPAAAWMRVNKDGGSWCTLAWFLKPDNTENTVSKARAAPVRPRGMAADASTQAQVQKLPIRHLPLASGGAP